MKWVGLLAILILSTFGYSQIIESGDNGQLFANITAEEKCLLKDVKAVYICFGNNVRVVSAISGEGSTFYKPDGRIVECPVAQPKDIGAECLQMMLPNFCPELSVCGEIPEQVFPGQNDTPEQIGDLDYYSQGEKPEEIIEPIIEKPIVPNKTISKTPVQNPNNNEDLPRAIENDFDGAFFNLIWIIVILGIGAMAVLFFTFRKSIAEE